MMPNDIATVREEFARALGEILTRVSLSAGNSGNANRIAVAYSGGLDSAALLHLVHACAQTHALEVFAFHVHHGLSVNADHWLAHCRQQSIKKGIRFDSREIRVARDEKNGIEEAARLGRYAALGEMCHTHGVALILTAHHQDDQAETVLLQLLRGSGVAGLSGMEGANFAPDLLGDAELLMGRPLLQLCRADLEAWVRLHTIDYVEDESNRDMRYARNALRLQVMPALQRFFPAFQQRFARTALHAQSAQRLLVELAAQDLAVCLDGSCLEITKLKQLSDDRIDNVLRYWFASHDVRMPSTSWLAEMRSQVLDARHDAQICVTHADCHIRRHRDLVFITPKTNSELPIPPTTFVWNGEPSMTFPAFGGTLYFELSTQGINVQWLLSRPLTIKLRSGGERLKPALNRPTRSVKYHYQACDVPPWERARLPLLFAGSQLLFAAGIGLDCCQIAAEAGENIQLRWAFD